MSKELRVYKPGTNGSAVKFQKRVDKKNYDELMAFAEFANQVGKDTNGNARFDWKSEDNPNGKFITIKLSELDIAKMLLVLRDQVDKIGLFHDPNKSYQESDGVKRNTVFNLSKGDRGYMFNVSNQVGTELKKVNISLTWEEGILLQSWCDTFLQQFYA